MRAREGGASIIPSETVVSTELSPKKIFGQKIFGSNLFLKNRKIGFTPINPYATLRVARENFSENERSCVLARLYEAARTYFTLNT